MASKWNITLTKFANEKPVTIEIASGKKLVQSVPVYVLGGFMDIDKLVEISANYGIPLIEDSTEALSREVLNVEWKARRNVWFYWCFKFG